MTYFLDLEKVIFSFYDVFYTDRFKFSSLNNINTKPWGDYTSKSMCVLLCDKNKQFPKYLANDIQKHIIDIAEQIFLAIIPRKWQRSPQQKEPIPLAMIPEKSNP